MKILSILALLAASLASDAAQYFASPTGNDANAGTIGSPWRNTSKAAATAVAGDTVTFSAGTYPGNVTFGANGSSGSKITFSGGTWTGSYTVNGDYVVLTNQLFTANTSLVINITASSVGAEIRNATYNTGLATRFVLIDGSNALIDSCNITDLALGTSGGGTFCATSGDNIVISNNRIHDYDNMEAFGYIWGRNNTISFNTVTNCLNSRYDLVHADFLQCFAYAPNVVSSNIVVNGNRIINSDVQAFMLNGANTGVPQSPNMLNWYIHNNLFQNSWQSGSCYLQGTRIENNTFDHWGYNNGYCFVVRDGAGSGSYSSGTNVFVQNNTAIDRGGSGGGQKLYSNEVGASTTVRNNFAAGFNGGNWFARSFSEGTGNITGSPLFIAIGATNANNNYAIQTASPLKDAALTIASFSTDIAGLSRPQGPAWDIGAYEFSSSPPPTPTPQPSPPPSRKRHLTVIGGSGSGDYDVGATVNLSANVFANWAGAIFSNPRTQSTSMVMPDADTRVEAVFASVPPAPPVPPPQPSEGITIFPRTLSPAVVTADAGSVELGVKFSSNRAATIKSILVYRGTGNGGTAATIWSDSGVALAKGTLPSAGTGWIKATLPAPLAIDAAKTYVASYFAPQGRFSYTRNFFSNPYTTSGMTASTGVYRYGSSSGFPNASYQASNYFVDIEF